jgi:nitrilase
MKIAAAADGFDARRGAQPRGRPRLVAEAARGGDSCRPAEVLLPHGPARRRQAGHRRGRWRGPIQAFLSAQAREHGCGWSAARCRSARRDGPRSATPAASTRPTAARRALRQDSPLPLRQRPRELRRGPRARSRRRAGRTAGRALRLGLSVCYDLRFPSCTAAVLPTACDLLSVPAAFTYTTGRAHWELLLRARAVENQCYVIAPRRAARTRTAAAPGATA